MDDAIISSPANPHIKTLIALRTRRTRSERAECLVEGHAEVDLALRAGIAPIALYHCPELYPQTGSPGSPTELLHAARERGATVVRLTRAAFEKAAYRQGPDGILAVVPALNAGLDALILGERPLVIVAQGVEKPGNLGAMLRTADAAGVSALIAADPVTDWGNPNVVRASKGTVFAVQVATATTEATLGWLADAGIPLLATTPAAEQRYDEIDYRGPVAIAVGAERTGLDAAALTAATYRVSIPMHGLVDSLNVATTMALVTFEAVRQRRQTW
ncbi:MAG: RNA methyltransferase [Austwickia sp.]|jgi:TrmH family RNA methyltransferase|nr:RNA methyltransferase [Austwickia sp.]MBK8437083.1 RNA methyltransferase [Austwickia sp.]MBK9102318.1 RNA methyltransferase [Austwickia sp.]